MWDASFYYDVCEAPEVDSMIEQRQKATGTRAMVDVSELPGINVAIKLSRVRGEPKTCTVPHAFSGNPEYTHTHTNLVYILYTYIHTYIHTYAA